MGRPQRSYSENEKAAALAALAANAGNVSHTARQIGIPAKTIENWSRGQVHADVARTGEEKKIDLADKLELVAHKLADAMDGKIADASLQQVATSFAITIDKMRLLREQSTSITGKQLSDAERMARLGALADRARAARMGGTDRRNGNPTVDPTAGAANGSVPLPGG